MYGMVNQAVRGLVLQNFGSDAWTRIHTKAGAPETFAAMQPYGDDVTYNLVGAACEVLQLPADAVLRAFGQYWVKGIATQHYGTLMASTGVDFADFLSNLDHMHQRIRVTFPDYQPPSFRVKRLDGNAPGGAGDAATGGTLQIDYFSHRPGLLPFVEGLFQGLAEHFGVTVTFEHIDDAAHRLPCKRIIVRYGKVE